MFGLSWGQIAIIVLVGVFVLGPERIPTAVSWVMSSLRKVRTMAAGAQAELRREIGPELDELRRQVADLQSLKEIQDLRDLRDLHPKRLIGKNILGDEFSGGITGFLGLNGHGPDSAASAGADPLDGAGHGSNGSANGPAVGDVPPHLPPSMTKSLAAPKVVGGATAHAPIKTLAAGERPPFDPDGT
jgi:sec-independent protein translocase protein TatB